MCGRFTLRATPAELMEIFEILREADFPIVPRYNIAPTQQVPAVRLSPEGDREWALLRWGLIPHWAKEAKIGSNLINASGESLAEKPSFREAFRKRRCLIPADGFYEWQAIAGQKTKQPLFIHRRDGKPFAFAGMWDRWRAEDGTDVATFTIVTTEANDLLKPIHERMPVILRDEHFAEWLDAPKHPPAEVQHLLQPLPSGELQLSPVSTRVNNARIDDPACLDRPASQTLF
jgi:putative SOS response-associated peptidase YedK